MINSELKKLKEKMDKAFLEEDLNKIRAVAKNMTFLIPRIRGGALWKIQGGYDGQIENATCISCGYINPVVHQLEELPKKCPCCHKTMVGYDII